MIDVTLYTAKLSNHYSWGSDEAQFLKEQEKLVKAGFTPKLWEEGSSMHPYIEESANITVDQSRLAELLVFGIELTEVKPLVVKVNIAEHLSAMAEKQLNIQVPSRNEYNNRCEVHMPGQALSLYNDMKLLEDSCTDVLQEALNEGWRIIAACPQPGQRRPDYILGRFDPKHDGDRSAKR